MNVKENQPKNPIAFISIIYGTRAGSYLEFALIKLHTNYTKRTYHNTIHNIKNLKFISRTHRRIRLVVHSFWEMREQGKGGGPLMCYRYGICV